ncbi:hypothetical protein ACWEQC_11370 [Streptomyces shenzhenensis]
MTEHGETEAAADEELGHRLRSDVHRSVRAGSAREAFPLQPPAIGGPVKNSTVSPRSAKPGPA